MFKGPKFWSPQSSHLYYFVDAVDIKSNSRSQPWPYVYKLYIQGESQGHPIPVIIISSQDQSGGVYNES